MNASWQPTATPATLRLRAALLARLREYFVGTRALEVETPALSAACVTDVHLASVAADVGGARRYLHTSPEYAMKRLLAAGHADIWQVARVYRDGETSRHHLPEFTLAEWYRVGMDHHALMDDVERLVNALLQGLRALGPTRRATYADVMLHHAGIDAFVASIDELATAITAAGLDLPGHMGGDRDAYLDLLMAAVVGPQLGRNHMTFVYDYPASQAALARVRGTVASRFELYLDGIELANGFHELASEPEQRARFDADLKQRQARGLTAAVIDERFLDALASGLPECAGVALGFDRLLMCATGARDIAEVVAFGRELSG